MPVLNARFTLLSIFCSLAAQSLSPSYAARAAVIARSPGYAGLAQSTDHDDAGLRHNQALFSFPWAQKRDGDSSGTDHKVLRRSHLAIAVSNNHGGKHRVNHRRQASTPAWAVTPRNNSFFNSTASTGQECIPGTVAIMSSSNNPDGGKTLGYLFLDPPNRNFDASETNRTKLCLADDPNTSASTTRKRLILPDSATSEPDCATYDPDPNAPSPISAEQCGEQSAHKSQIFLYEPSTGNIQPLPQDDPRGTGSGSTQSSYSSSLSTPSMSAGAADASAPSSAVPSPSSTPASLGRRDDNLSSQNLNSGMNTQNVTLVFIPERTTNNASAAVSVAPTSTVTQTVTVYSSSSPSALYAASATPSASSSAAAAFVTGLNIEIVGGGFSSASASGMAQATGAAYSPAVAASSSYGMAAATQASMPSSAVVSPSASVNVAQVASSIVSSYPPSASSSMPSSAVVSPSASVNVAQVASSIVSSYPPSASSSTPSPAAVGAASASASSSSASPSSSVDPSVANFAAEVLERNASPEVTPSSTDPYFWRFKSDHI